MRAGVPLRKSAALSAMPAVVFGGLAGGAMLVAPDVAWWGFAPMAVIATLWIARLRHGLDDVTRRVGAMNADLHPVGAAPSATGIAELESRVASLGHRARTVHAISGFPVRERLVERIVEVPHGSLGLIAFDDFDRLSAFDPDLAGRVLLQCAARLREMVPIEHFLAQLDRGLIGIWFAPAVDPRQAGDLLRAIAYALGAEVRDGDTRLIPQVTFRIVPHDVGEGVAPEVFVTRAVAAFSLSDAGATAVADAALPAAGQVRDRFALEQDLRRAVERGELRLAYQPLVDARAGGILGAEALIRWDHPTRGTIPPSHFVPVIEAMGLSSEVGTWALNTAVREARVWATMGLEHLRVAVNVSSTQLEEPGFLQRVQRTLHSHRVSAAQLEIELTESVATSNTDHCRTTFEALRALGVRLAVDDFGTGYSGFSSLRALAFDKIKIDREFVTHVDTRRDCQAICNSIIALGRGLGIRVLAEGVERYAEYQWLRTHGCDVFQGYLFGAPMEPAAFIARVQDRAWLADLLGTGGLAHAS